MPINFDPNSLNGYFDQTFGKGSFNQGIQQAYRAGQLKQQASIAQSDFTSRLNKLRTAQMSNKKSYQDAINELQNSGELNNIRNQGAYGYVNNIKNDPQKQAEIKAKGYNLNDYYNAIYNAASDGKFKSQRDYNQYASQLNKDTKAQNKAFQDANGGLTQDQVYQMNQNQQKQSQHPSLLSTVKTDALKALDFLNRPSNAVLTGINDKLHGGSFLQGLEQGFSGKKNTSGVDVNKSLGFDPNKNKIVSALDNFLGQAILNKLPGGVGRLTSPFINNNLKTKLGEQTAGMSTAVATDPLNLIGGGLVSKGLEGLGKLSKGAKAAEELLALPEPQLRLNAPQLQLQAPKPIQYSSLEDLLNVGKQPKGLQSPIPKMPTTLKNELQTQKLKNAGLGFGYNSSLEPKARMPIAPTELPKFAQEGIVQKGDNLLNTVSQMDGKPSNYFTNRLLQVQKEMKSINDKRANYRPSLSVDELYNRVKTPNDPATFDELVKMNQLEANASKNAPVQGPRQGNLKDALNTDPRIKALAKQLHFKAPEQKVSRLATLDEMAQRMQQSLPPKALPPELKPLEFKTTKVVKGNGPLGKLKGPNPYEAINSAKDITAPNPADGHGYGLIDTQAEANKISPDVLKEIQNIKDINQLQVGTKTPYEIANMLPKPLGDKIKNAFDTAKINHVQHLEQTTNDLFNKVVSKDGLGIKAGSKESALVQDYGEKTLAKKYLRSRGIDPAKVSNEEMNKINLIQLKKLRPNDWQNFVKADKYFRDNYNQLIDQVNATRKQIYPNNPDKIVPKRTDYYHHFNDLTGMEGVKNLFETPSNIDPHLEGISPFTTPKAKFQGFMQKRGNGRYVSDAVGGYLKYLRAASHSIHVDPVIPVLRNTSKTLADATEQTRNANKIIESLNDTANDIAGKTNPYDRLLQKIIGRTSFRILNAANSRVKGNMILGNLSSMLGQVGNVPLGIAKAKQFSAPGLADTLTQAGKTLLSKTPLMKNDLTDPIYHSQFLKERYSDQLFRRFDQKLLQQPKRLALWMMETADKSGTNFVWNSMYRKGLAQKVADPIKYADTETRNIVAGRGIGEVPLLQKAKTTQILAPFTLEVGNQWKVLSKMVGQKDAAGILTFLVASYGLNKAMENIRGSGVSFDPVGAFQQGYTTQDGNTAQKLLNGAASLGGEVVGNVPFGNLITNQVNTNNKIPLTNMKISQLFGERNPNRFGTGLTLGKMFTDPLYALAPFGASQFRKATQGVDALMNGGVYKGDNGFIPFTGDKKQLMYPLKKGSLENAKLPLFGPSSYSTGQQYYNNKQQPLSPKQTQAYHLSGDSQSYYDNLTKQKRLNTIKSNIKKVQQDKSLSNTDRNTQLLRLLAQMQNLQK